MRYLPDRDNLALSNQRKTLLVKPGLTAPVRASEQLGAWIRAQRKAHGLTQVQVAEIAGVGPRFISELERGKPTVHLGKVFAVLEILGLTVRLEDIDPDARPRSSSR